MEKETGTGHPSKKSFWIGWILGILPALLLIISASFKFVQPEGIEKKFRAHRMAN